MTDASIVIHPRGLRIPAGVGTLEAFRDWCRSDAFPRGGRIDFLAGEVDIDVSPEDLNTHGSLKVAIAYRLHAIVVEELAAGLVLSDSTRLSAPEAALSAEPDVLVLLQESLDAGRAALVPKAADAEGFFEIEGAVDLVVECVSDSSVGKDESRLLELYDKAGVRESWIVDGRGAAPSLRLHGRADGALAPVAPTADGWHASAVLARSVRLVRLPIGGQLTAWRLETR